MWIFRKILCRRSRWLYGESCGLEKLLPSPKESPLGKASANADKSSCGLRKVDVDTEKVELLVW